GGGPACGGGVPRRLDGGPARRARALLPRRRERAHRGSRPDLGRVRAAGTPRPADRDAGAGRALRAAPAPLSRRVPVRQRLQRAGAGALPATRLPQAGRLVVCVLRARGRLSLTRGTPRRHFGPSFGRSRTLRQVWLRSAPTSAGST